MATRERQPAPFRFESFELDPETGELYRNGGKVKLQDQPARLLILLIKRAGTLVTREEIQKELWGDGQFVEFEHAINVAVKKIREVLEDDAATPRFVETLPKKGYRFIAALEETEATQETEKALAPPAPPAAIKSAPETPRENPPLKAAEQVRPAAMAETAADETALEKEFALPRSASRLLFMVLQLVYLLIYCLTLAYMFGVARVLDRAGIGWLTVPVLVAAACGIPIRLYLLFTVGSGHPAAGFKYRRLLPYLMPWDWLWALAPFLAIDTFGPGWSTVFTAILVYPPISQWILMRSIYHPRHNRPGA